ncbi:hypothetical protein GGF32_006289 [Allomyces javanicus]|nr:hypothetical protein GGF32_006289 [Allomyces javanicus]
MRLLQVMDAYISAFKSQREPFFEIEGEDPYLSCLFCLVQGHPMRDRNLFNNLITAQVVRSDASNFVFCSMSGQPVPLTQRGVLKELFHILLVCVYMVAYQLDVANEREVPCMLTHSVVDGVDELARMIESMESTGNSSRDFEHNTRESHTVLVDARAWARNGPSGSVHVGDVWTDASALSVGIDLETTAYTTELDLKSTVHLGKLDSNVTTYPGERNLETTIDSTEPELEVTVHPGERDMTMTADLSDSVTTVCSGERNSEATVYSGDTRTDPSILAHGGGSQLLAEFVDDLHENGGVDGSSTRSSRITRYTAMRDTDPSKQQYLTTAAIMDSTTRTILAPDAMNDESVELRSEDDSSSICGTHDVDGMHDEDGVTCGEDIVGGKDFVSVTAIVPGPP